jgi:hypothetical protein
VHCPQLLIPSHPVSKRKKVRKRKLLFSPLFLPRIVIFMLSEVYGVSKRKSEAVPVPEGAEVLKRQTRVVFA